MSNPAENTATVSKPLRPVVFIYAAANAAAFLVMMSSVMFTTFPAG